MVNNIELNHVKHKLNNIKEDRILLAISGGVDSVFLLDLLLSSNIKPILFFINYNPDDNSNSREEICKEISRKKNIELISKTIYLNSKNFESKARKKRYDLLNCYANDNNIDWILTAHHKDDQLETLYMKYEDNADWISFLGIRETYNKIYRPLLNVTKKTIIEYANVNKLNWFDDISNKNLNFRRNKLRAKKIPIIKDEYPELVEYLFNENSKCIERFNLLKVEINKYLKLYVKNQKKEYSCISNDVIMITNQIKFKLFYQHILADRLHSQVNCTRKHWENLYKFIKTSRCGSQFEINENIKLLKDREFHYIYNDKFIMQNNITIKYFDNDWYDTKFLINDQNNKNFNYIDSFNLSKDIFERGVTVRNWKNGDKFYNKESNSYKSLKKAFIKNKISVFEKKIYPIILNSNDEIIFIPNIYNRYKYTDFSKNLITLSWVAK